MNNLLLSETSESSASCLTLLSLPRTPPLSCSWDLVPLVQVQVRCHPLLQGVWPLVFCDVADRLDSTWSINLGSRSVHLRHVLQPGLRCLEPFHPSRILCMIHKKHQDWPWLIALTWINTSSSLSSQKDTHCYSSSSKESRTCWAYEGSTPLLVSKFPHTLHAWTLTLCILGNKLGREVNSLVGGMRCV